MAIVNEYTLHAIDPEILSTLNIDQSGEVVSAETWVRLWELVLGLLIEHNQHFADIYRTLTDINTELTHCIADVEILKTNYNALNIRVNALDITWTALQQTYNEIAGHYDEIKDIYDALKNSFIHYGIDPPTLDAVKLWVMPAEISNTPFYEYIFQLVDRIFEDLDRRLRILEEDYASVYRLIGGFE